MRARAIISASTDRSEVRFESNREVRACEHEVCFTLNSGQVFAVYQIDPRAIRGS